MMPDIPLWWILGAGVVLSSWWTTRVFGAGINTEVFVNVMERVLRDKNVMRALKLTAATDHAPAGIATRAALLASISREEDAKRPAGYRDRRPISIDIVKGRVRMQYDVAFSTSATRLTSPFYLAILTPLLFAVVLFLKFSWPEPTAHVIAAGLGILAWIYIGSQHLKILRSRNVVFDQLWPSFEAVYHERHALNTESKPAYPLPKEPQTTGEVMIGKITFDILEPGKPLRRESFDQEIIKIGRLPTAHLQLEADGVARLHAVVEIADGKATIIDLGAAKQTTVNGQTVNKTNLANGDVIGIGDVELVVRHIAAFEKPNTT